MDLSKYVSGRYLSEKIKPVRNLITKIEASDGGDLSESLSEYERREIAFAFAVIAKELDVEIPTDV